VATVAPDRFQGPFQMHLERRGKAAVLRLVGEFDLTVKKTFEAGLSGLASGRPKQVVIDLRDVNFIDSTGIRLILEAWNQSRRMGLDFAVRLGEGPVRKALSELGLDQALPIVEDSKDSRGTSGAA
jgi:anti-anti-sigma factor